MRKTMLATLLLSLALATVASAQNNQSADERTALQAAQNYMDAYYSADPARMQEVLHPDFRKHTLRIVNGQVEAEETSTPALLEGVRSGSGKQIPPSERVQRVEVLDVYKDAANIKVTTGRWVDYMLLSKVNGEWRVLDVVLQYTNR
jgi:Putative lumazine-binding